MFQPTQTHPIISEKLLSVTYKSNQTKKSHLSPQWRRLYNNVIDTINSVKLFSKFYYQHSKLIVKSNICLKTLLQQDISEPVFYGDIVYKVKRIVGKPKIIDQFKNILKRYKRVGYNVDIMRQSACLVVNPITVESYGFLLNCTTMGQSK